MKRSIQHRPSQSRSGSVGLLAVVLVAASCGEALEPPPPGNLSAQTQGGSPAGPSPGPQSPASNSASVNSSNTSSSGMMRASGSSTADETSPAPGPGGAGFGGFFGGNGFGGQAMPSASPTPAPDPNSAGTGGFFGAGMGSTDNPAPSTSSAPSMMCTPLAVGASSGNIGTEARCFTVTGTIAGWQVSSLAPRTLTVNGANVSAPALPAAINGAYTFAFSAGEPEYTQFNTW